MPPTNGDNAFVSGNTTAGNIFAGGEGWVSAAIVATTVIASPGTHTIKVVVDGAHGGASRFDDMSLVVLQETTISPPGFRALE